MTVRYSIDLPAKLRIGSTDLSARIRNVSLGGVFIVGPALTIGSRCTITFVAPNGETITSECVSRWTTADGCGLMFDGANTIDEHQLASVIRDASRTTIQRMRRLSV